MKSTLTKQEITLYYCTSCGGYQPAREIEVYRVEPDDYVSQWGDTRYYADYTKACIYSCESCEAYIYDEDSDDPMEDLNGCTQQWWICDNCNSHHEYQEDGDSCCG